MKVTVHNYYNDYETAYKNVIKVTEYTYGGFTILLENGSEIDFDCDWDYGIDNLM